MTVGDGRVRVAVWGTGAVGGAVIRTLLRNPSLQLVGALTYSSEKVGRDVGDTIGTAETGVVMTSTRDELIASRPDVVVFAPLDIGTDDDVVALLRAGVNVVTPLGYRGLRFRDDGAYERFQSSAVSGRSTLYVTGINPDLVQERIVLTLASATTEISHVTVKEIFRCENGALIFDAAGFGKPLDEVGENEFIKFLGEQYFGPSIRIASELMGHFIDRIDVSLVNEAAPMHIDTALGPIARGTLGSLVLRLEGYCGDEIFYAFEGYYFCGGLRPTWAGTDDSWLIEIEGRPSIRVVIDTWASIRDQSLSYYEDPTSPGYYIVAASLVNAIPNVVGAPPGIMDTQIPAGHWLAHAELAESRSASPRSATTPAKKTPK